MRVLLASTIALITLTAATRLAAAPQVYADPAGTCNGLTPCFTTVTQAVANAGPAPANVGVFPGTYAESVDLSTMGSAIAGAPGELVVEALDASGQPATTGVTIEPPSGVALLTGMGTPFPGDLTVRGLTVRSPDATAMGLIVDGNLLLQDLIAQLSPQIGTVAVADGNLTVERVLATLNDATGLIAAASGETVLRDVIGLRNGGTGLAVQGELGVLLDGVDAEFNEDGLQAASCNALVIQDSLIGGNMLTGGTLEAGTPNCEFMGVRNHPALQGLFSLPAFDSDRGGEPRGVSPSVNASNLLTRANGDYGLAVIAPDAPASLVDVFANDNDSIGITIEAGDLMLEGVESLRNQAGIFARADTVDALRVIANDSLTMPANPPLDGSGLILLTNTAVIDDLQADNNPETGLLIGQTAPGLPLSIELIGSQFDGNGFGVAVEADVPYLFNADEVFIDNHSNAGMSLLNVGSGTLARIEANGNVIGLALGVAGELRVERSSFTDNTIGTSLNVDPFALASVVCSDFSGNTTGLGLLADESADATFNYWGDPSGPSHPGNPGGTGDAVLDSANSGNGTAVYVPFLAAPATDADCPAGVPEPTAIPTLNVAGRGGLILVLTLAALMALSLRARP